MRRLFIVSAVALLAAGGGLAAALVRPPAGESGWRVETVTKGPLVSAVSATGRLRAVVTVQVGSQVSGQISELLADFNHEVAAGQPVARLDARSFQAKLRAALAEKQVAEAAVLQREAESRRAEAEIVEARSTLAEAIRDLSRIEPLEASGHAPRGQLDKARGARDQAAARLEAMLAGGHVAQAALASAVAQVAQREAAVEQARVDLDRTDIRSPVDGVVVERSVDLGQTVAASLQAPTLFTIARDLGRMQVDVSVDEADIGRVRRGAKAGFAVDAHPGRLYEGRVEQIRLAPTVTQNVVTYTVVVTADNPDRSLLPGMTAEVRIVDQERAGTLLLPNGALRFHPPGEHGRAATVWLPGPGGEARPQPVTTGIADGAVTEVLSGLSEGQTVIVGSAAPVQPRKSGGLGFGFGR